MLGTVVKGAIRLSTLGLATGPHMTRYRMYHDLEQALAPIAKPAGTPTVLAVARSMKLSRRLVPHGEIIDAEYPQYDLLDLHHVPTDSLDYVIADQVLEHVQGSPQQALDETRRVLKPGGLAIHTTCLLQELHGGVDRTGHLHDYWRFTPNGLAHLCQGFSRIVTVGSWGNRLAFFGLRYLPVPHATWHPLHKIAMSNTPSAPMLTWIVAQK